jgi:Xaa-Pro aminopeptidase
MSIVETNMSAADLSDEQYAVASSFSHADRWTRVRRVIAEERLDAIVAVGPSYATWLTDYHRYSAGVSATVVGPSDRTDLVVSADEAPVAELESSATRVHAYGEPGFGLDLDTTPGLLELLGRIDILRRCSRVGVAGLAPAVLGGALGYEVVPVDGRLEAVMAVKDRDEAARIARSYGLCLEAQAVVGLAVAEGASELELFTRGHSTAQLAAGEPVEYIADVLSGATSAEVSGPVAVAGRRAPADGEPVLADILVRARGYWGDTCRTHVRGQNGELEGLLERLQHVLDETVGELRPGVRASAVHIAMAARLQDAFPGSVPLPHHGGHGLGLAPLASPNLSPRDDTMLQAGMILAVEPGAYFPGRFGMRHENEYLVTAAGGIELNAAMASLPTGANDGTNH